MNLPRKTGLLTASLVLALVAACVAAIAAAILALSTKPAEAAFPGTNGVIAYRGDCWPMSIFRVRPDGTGVTPLTCDLAAFAQHPAFSADGKRIAFQNDADDLDEFGRDLWVMDANGENKTQITDTPNVDEW
jgi:hypothetical protein